MEGGKDVDAIFIDITKAFDSVQLIQTLLNKSMYAYAVNWVKKLPYITIAEYRNMAKSLLKACHGGDLPLSCAMTSPMLVIVSGSKLVAFTYM